MYYLILLNFNFNKSTIFFLILLINKLYCIYFSIFYICIIIFIINYFSFFFFYSFIEALFINYDFFCLLVLLLILLLFNKRILLKYKILFNIVYLIKAFFFFLIKSK